MDKFFALYLSEAKPTPPQALAAAQKYVRHITLGELKLHPIGGAIVDELREDDVAALSSNPDDDDDASTPLAKPYFWGAWICQG
jgi:CHAT domain-containing protein